MNIKNIVKKLPILYPGGVIINKLLNFIIPVKGKNNRLCIQGRKIGLKKSIIGSDNYVQIKDSTLINCTVRIRGNGNRLFIEKGCYIGNGCSFWLEGNNNTIVIGRNTTMTMLCHFNAQEHDTTIHIGEDCMFSNNIIVRTSDSHPIYDQEGIRINPAKNVELGNHVWIAPSSVIMKGAKIGNGCIVGSHTMVNKTIPNNCLIVGMPAKIVKENINWTREDIIK